MATCWTSLYYDEAMGKPFTIANALMGVLFFAGAAVQYNDPDPLGWVAIYLAAAACCVAFRRHRLAGLAASMTAAAAIAWSVRIYTEMPRWVAPAQMFEPMESYGGAVEMAREATGLAIIAAWMLVLAWRRERPGAQQRDPTA
jgi:hypothetical protein